MPTATAVFPQSVKNLKTRVSNVDKTTLITDSPPDWATGNFSGTWGNQHTWYSNNRIGVD